MKFGSPPMTSFRCLQAWDFLAIASCVVFFSVSSTSVALTLQTPSRPTAFPLQVMETNGPLHPVAWGANNNKQSEVILNLTNLVQIASSPSAYHNVGLLDDGTVIAWGMTNHGRVNVPQDLRDVVQVAAGGSHSLALKSDGTVVAWGLGTEGQTAVPSDLPPAVEVEGGVSHTVALLQDGTVAAWGNDSFGQCDIPPNLTNVVQISSGSYFNLALTANGGVNAWGSYIDTESNLPFPFTNPVGLSNLVQVAAGGLHAVALKNDATVVAWGDNSAGQCDVPLGLTNVVQVAAGWFHSLALVSDGSVISWGENGLHQCDVPMILTNAVQVSGGASHSIALATRIPQAIAPLTLPSFVNFSNTPSISVPSPIAIYSYFDSRGNLTNAPSGLSASLSLLSGPATLTNGILTFSGIGTIVLEAEQRGNGLYLPVTAQTSIVSTVPRSQTISFSGPLTIPFTTDAVALLGSASSGLPLSFSTADSSVATISGGYLIPRGVGTTTIRASQVGTYSNSMSGDVSRFWLPVTSAPQTLSIIRGSQTLTPFAPIGAQPVNSTLNITNMPRSSSGLPVSLSVKSGPATLSGTLLSLTGGGTVTLAANQSGNGNFYPAPEVTVSFPVLSPRSQTITFPALAPIPYGLNPVPIHALSDSGLPVSFTVSDSSIAIVSGTNLLLRGIGTTTIVASQSGNAVADQSGDVSTYWSAARTITNSLVVIKGSQTLTPFTSIPPLAVGATFDLNSLTNLTASSGLPVTFRVVSGNAAINASNGLVANGTGAIVLAAEQNGSPLYDPAAEISTTIFVRLGQSIDQFQSIVAQIFKPRLTVAVKVPASSSRLPVDWGVLSGPATRAGNALSVSGGGTVTLYAEQAGNSNYVTAPRVTTSFVVRPAVQTIGKMSLKNVVFGTSPITIPTPASSSGYPVTVSLSSNSLSIANLRAQASNTSLLTITGAGTVTVTASQSGNNSYLPASNSVSFVVARSPQTISPFSKIADVAWTNTRSLVITTPAVSSRLQALLSVKSGPARLGAITNGLVTFTNRGKITITADQPGDQNFLPAKQVSVSFTVK